MNINSTSTGSEIITSSGSVAIRQIFGIGRNYAAHAYEQGLEMLEHLIAAIENLMMVDISDGNLSIHLLFSCGTEISLWSRLIPSMLG
jgi:hypothetical protein